MAMTYEEYKAAVIAEFPPRLHGNQVVEHLSFREHCLLLGDPPLEERLEICRSLHRRAIIAADRKIASICRAVLVPDAADAVADEGKPEAAATDATPAPAEIG